MKQTGDPYSARLFFRNYFGRFSLIFKTPRNRKNRLFRTFTKTRQMTKYTSPGPDKSVQDAQIRKNRVK